MSTRTPAISAQVTDIPSDAGFLLSPPVAWNTVAEQIAVEAGSAIDGNRVHEKGELHGSAVPKLQDTYISGSAGRVGKAFTVVSGTVQDDWVSTRTQSYGLLVPKSSDTWDVVAASADAQILPAQIVLRRGVNPVGNTPTRVNYFAYLELQYGGLTNYRIALEWGKPLRLDYFFGGWFPVDVSKLIPDIETYLEQNNDTIALKVLPDYMDGTLTIRVGNSVALKHAPPGGLVAYGNVRFTGQNGWASLEYYPLRFQPLTVWKSQRDFGDLKPVGRAALQLNSRGKTDPTQTYTSTLTGNGQSVGHTTTVSLPDAGDGLGSLNPPKLVDATIVIPAVWTDAGTTFGGTIFMPPVMRADLLETFDDATRTYTSSANLPINNWNSRYTGSYGHVAVSLAIATGEDPYTYCFKGIGGGGPSGIEFYRQDPTRLMTLPCSDNSYKMQVPLAQEVCFDGWCIFSAVRFLCECGNVHPRFLQTIPFYMPPGASYDAPYGPAGADCPYYILGRGTGLNAKYKFLPDWTPWAVLQRLVQDAGDTDPLTGQNIPYYMGFLGDQFHFEAYNPRNLLPIIAYSERDTSGYGQIEEIRVYNSVWQMRTSIDFQGIDAFTNELLYYHLNLPDSVMRAVGFRYAWLERDARFASQDYMVRIANNAAVQASIPTQVWTVKVPYHPGVRAGMVALTVETQALGGAVLGYITEIRSSVGLDDLTGQSGTQSCYSYVTMRSVSNF